MTKNTNNKILADKLGIANNSTGTPAVTDETSAPPIESSKICPNFPAEVHEYVDQIMALRRVLLPVYDRYGMTEPKVLDAAIMSALTKYSTLCSHVRFAYGNRVYSLNLQFFYVAFSGTGKGELAFSCCIYRGVNLELEAESLRKRADYKERLAAWEDEKRDAKAQHRAVNTELDPGEEPPFRFIAMPAATSKSNIVINMATNEEDGLIISTTEASTLTRALKAECGQFGDVICKAGENEPVEQFYKVDGQPVRCEYSMLSIDLAGILDQIHALFPTFKDGGFSRMDYIVGDASDAPGFVSQRPDYAKNYDELADEIAADALNFWRWQRSFDRLEVRFSDTQWERHTAFWSKREEELKALIGSEYIGVVRRLATRHMRLAALLTVLKAWEEVRDDFVAGTFDTVGYGPLYCSDATFDVAESMAAVLIEHSLSLVTTKREHTPKDMKDMTDWRWQHEVLAKGFTEEELSMGITPADFTKAAKRMGHDGKAASTYNRAFKHMVKARQLKRVPNSMPKRYRPSKVLTQLLRKKYPLK